MIDIIEDTTEKNVLNDCDIIIIIQTKLTDLKYSYNLLNDSSNLGIAKTIDEEILNDVLLRCVDKTRLFLMFNQIPNNDEELQLYKENSVKYFQAALNYEEALNYLINNSNKKQTIRFKLISLFKEFLISKEFCAKMQAFRRNINTEVYLNDIDINFSLNDLEDGVV